MINTIYDIFIIGGGINGTGIAAEAAGHGLSVALCEKDDLASHTSSASSKLIHGGLRYLEHYEFKLVRESLSEREILLHKAPHLIHSIRFIMPQQSYSRPAWLIRLGLFLYDHLGRHTSLPTSKSLNLSKQLHNPLKKHLIKGFVYSDCQVDDARLVVVNALKAQELGAHIWTQTECIKATRESGLWTIHCSDRLTKKNKIVQAKALINATGPWTESFLAQQCNLTSPLEIKLVKGSHIVLPKLYLNPDAYILQNKDGRVVFVVPYQNDFTMIGTTDVSYKGDPNKVEIDENEINYLCTVYNDYFSETIKPSQIVSHWSGVRPLYDDHHANPSEITRDYKLDIQTINEQCPIISVFGGKITTYRHLAEQAFSLLKPFFPHLKKYDTHSDCLPGGNIPNLDMPFFIKVLQKQYPWLPTELCKRYANTYGTHIFILLSGKKSIQDLGADHGHGLYETEINYLKTNEWAHTTEDILWRRTKLGLYLKTITHS